MELKPILEKIDFANRYRKICDSHLEFDNRLSGNKNSVYKKVLDTFKYEYKFFSNGSFYQIKEAINERFIFQFHLVLKDGQIEPLLYIKIDNQNIDNMGRLDFIPQKLNIPFERKEFNLPLYSDEEELKEILKSLFSIYEDFKTEVLKSQL